MPLQTLGPAGQTGAVPGRRSGRIRTPLLVAVLVAALVPVVGVVGVAGAGAGAGAKARVAVFPGDSIQSAVNANPEGTTFLIKAGVHRRQEVVPKDGNVFVGEPGAVLTGEDVTEYAFRGTAVRVTIRNLVVEHYNSPSADYPIKCSSAGYWTVEGNEIRYNAHIGLGAGPRWVVRNNFIHHNGQMGIFAAGEDILIEGNEIAFNNTDGHNSQWEAGGTKFVYTIRLTVRNNYVHDNAGPGLWTDINNIHTLYEGNRVIGNHGPGIFHEISYDAVIRNNLVEGNGYGWTAWVNGAGILVANSPNVEVYGNTVRYNNDGIAGIQGARDQADARYGPWELKGLWVHDNMIMMEVGETGIVRGTADPVWSPEWGNRYDYNTYTLSGTARYYRWNADARTATEWQILRTGHPRHLDRRLHQCRRGPGCLVSRTDSPLCLSSHRQVGSARFRRRGGRRGLRPPVPAVRHYPPDHLHGQRLPCPSHPCDGPSHWDPVSAPGCRGERRRHRRRIAHHRRTRRRSNPADCAARHNR